MITKKKLQWAKSIQRDLMGMIYYYLGEIESEYVNFDIDESNIQYADDCVIFHAERWKWGYETCYIEMPHSYIFCEDKDKWFEDYRETKKQELLKDLARKRKLKAEEKKSNEDTERALYNKLKLQFEDE